ncbi:hypothetical protein GPS59_15320 [Acinetobacter haemolyticus]|uniref:hypothetical protein n=1 Tax=Acinetobacter haemolyticus TaxID=29430 RepID=UPI001372C20D|nr:hypothetical protein [Acinetobacter haemolyticus]NAR50129.1 hypothetical protein [Acinetobacter haemolyticus]NAR55310.1 hypothetical protein [Acinetobacter haemolyticus]
MGSIVDQYEIFEWFKQDLTVKSPAFNAANVRTTSNIGKIDYQDRIGVVGVLDTQFEKSVAALILFDCKTQFDYEYVRNYLAEEFIKSAHKMKKKEPKNIALYHLAWLIARLVIDFTFDDELERAHTLYGRLYYAGIKERQMNVDTYRMTWAHFEKEITQLLKDKISSLSVFMEEYKRQTISDAKI